MICYYAVNFIMYVRELTFFFVGSRIHVQIWFVKRRLGVSRALQRGRATRFIFCNNTVWYKFSLNWYTSISHFSSQWVLISQALHTRYMITLKNLAYVLVYAYSQVEEYTATSMNIYQVYTFFGIVLFSSITRGRFYPQRSSGQALVTVVVPSPPPALPVPCGMSCA